MCKQEKGRITNIYAKKTYQEEDRKTCFLYIYGTHPAQLKITRTWGLVNIQVYYLLSLKVKAIFTKRVTSSVKCTIDSFMYSCCRISSVWSNIMRMQLD